MKPNDNVQPICVNCIEERREKAQQHIITNGLHVGNFVKVPLGKEHVWVIVKAINKKTFEGILDSKPVNQEHTLGELVELKIKDIEQIEGVDEP